MSLENISKQTFMQRIRDYGYEDDEAIRLDPWEPRWVVRVEKEFGKPIRELIIEGAKAGKRAKDFAMEWGVHYQAALRMCRKHGVSWKVVPIFEGEE